MTLDEKNLSTSARTRAISSGGTARFCSVFTDEGGTKGEAQEWFDFSLSSALQDMDNEPALYYLTDIKVAFA